jgi:hypothetical protein
VHTDTDEEIEDASSRDWKTIKNSVGHRAKTDRISAGQPDFVSAPYIQAVEEHQALAGRVELIEQLLPLLRSLEPAVASPLWCCCHNEHQKVMQVIDRSSSRLDVR